MPCQRQDVPSYRVQNFRIDRIGGIGHAVGDALAPLGWHPDRQQKPASLHLMVTPAHETVVDTFLADLRTAAEQVRSGEVTGGRQAAVYGALDAMEDRGPVRDAIVSNLERITARES